MSQLRVLKLGPRRERATAMPPYTLPSSLTATCRTHMLAHLSKLDRPVPGMHMTL